MSATEIHNFLLSTPSSDAMRRLLRSEGINHLGHRKEGLEALLLDLLLARKG